MSANISYHSIFSDKIKGASPRINKILKSASFCPAKLALFVKIRIPNFFFCKKEVKNFKTGIE